MEIIRKHFPCIDSTNNWAKQQAVHFDRTAITLVTADEQTGGRGRFKRRWESPPHQNIYASYCFFLDKNRLDIGNIPQTMGISIVQMLQEWGFQAYLKWPNDVMLNGKKVAGILSESLVDSDHRFLVIGVGLNINMPTKILQTIDRPATSLFVEGGILLVIEEGIHFLNQKFRLNLDLFLKEGFSPFLEIYRAMLSLYLNKKICFHDNRAVWEGWLHSINSDGSLNFRTETGEIKTFVAGEILP